MKFVLLLILLYFTSISSISSISNISSSINNNINDNDTTTTTTTTITSSNMNNVNDTTKRYVSSELQESLLAQRILLASSSILVSLLSLSSSSLKTVVDVFVTVFNSLVVMISKSLRDSGDVLKDMVTITT